MRSSSDDETISSYIASLTSEKYNCSVAIFPGSGVFSPSWSGCPSLSLSGTDFSFSTPVSPPCSGCPSVSLSFGRGKAAAPWVVVCCSSLLLLFSSAPSYCLFVASSLGFPLDDSMDSSMLSSPLLLLSSSIVTLVPSLPLLLGTAQNFALGRLLPFTMFCVTRVIFYPGLSRVCCHRAQQDTASSSFSNVEPTLGSYWMIRYLSVPLEQHYVLRKIRGNRGNTGILYFYAECWVQIVPDKDHDFE